MLFPCIGNQPLINEESLEFVPKLSEWERLFFLGEKFLAMCN